MWQILLLLIVKILVNPKGLTAFCALIKTKSAHDKLQSIKNAWSKDEICCLEMAALLTQGNSESNKYRFNTAFWRVRIIIVTLTIIFTEFQSLRYRSSVDKIIKISLPFRALLLVNHTAAISIYFIKIKTVMAFVLKALYNAAAAEW